MRKKPNGVLQLIFYYIHRDALQKVHNEFFILTKDLYVDIENHIGNDMSDYKIYRLQEKSIRRHWYVLNL